MEGGLTRANMMNAVWSTDLSLPLAAAGKYKVDGTKDAYAVEDGYIAVFDPASGGYKDTGFKVNLEGQDRRLHAVALRWARPARSTEAKRNVHVSDPDHPVPDPLT